ncbi:MAG: transcription antitermination factor NusB [Desulfomonilaceae bacterium]|nr:transcription antitermination factor NusB [Desulfomonilaceae bacterium]
MPSRRKTREFVLQVLFAAEATKQNPCDVLLQLESHFRSDEEQALKLHRVMSEYARNLVSAVARDRLVIDKLISKVSHNWKLYRLNSVDRNVLRMAIAELVNFPEVPGPVILNEAIEIGRKYGADKSPSFINGVLDRIHVLEPRPTSAAHLHDLITKLDEPDSTV